MSFFFNLWTNYCLSSKRFWLDSVIIKHQPKLIMYSSVSDQDDLKLMKVPDPSHITCMTRHLISPMQLTLQRLHTCSLSSPVFRWPLQHYTSPQTSSLGIDRNGSSTADPLWSPNFFLSMALCGQCCACFLVLGADLQNMVCGPVSYGQSTNCDEPRQYR